MATAPAPNPQDGSTVDDILTLIFNNDPRAAQLIKQATLQGKTGAVATALSTASALVSPPGHCASPQPF